MQSAKTPSAWGYVLLLAWPDNFEIPLTAIILARAVGFGWRYSFVFACSSSTNSTVTSVFYKTSGRDQSERLSGWNFNESGQAVGSSHSFHFHEVQVELRAFGATHFFGDILHKCEINQLVHCRLLLREMSKNEFVGNIDSIDLYIYWLWFWLNDAWGWNEVLNWSYKSKTT